MSELTEQGKGQQFHVEHVDYTVYEALEIKKFMEGTDHPQFSILRGKRNGKFVMEIPPVPEAADIQDLLETELPDELQSVHPTLQRRDIFVRFVPKLKEETKGGKEFETFGDALDYREGNEKKLYVRISEEGLKDMDGDNRIVNIAGIVVHEIAEIDYYLKTPNAPKDSKAVNSEGYQYTEDEEIANRRALRVIKRKFPQVEYKDIKYPSDKD